MGRGFPGDVKEKDLRVKASCSPSCPSQTRIEEVQSKDSINGIVTDSWGWAGLALSTYRVLGKRLRRRTAST